MTGARTKEEEAAIAMAAENLGAYAQLMHRGFEMYRHNAELIKFLHRVERGEITRGLITMPPRHGKSLITSNLFQSWYLGRHPDRDVIACSHTLDLARAFAEQVRDNLDPNTVTGSVHNAIFPRSRLKVGSASKTDFTTTQGGGYRGAGRGGNIIGRGAHLITIDDPFKSRAEVMSELVREAAKRWYKAVVYTRQQPAGAAILMISTRWHPDDLVGYVLREHAHEGWEELHFAAIAEKDEQWRKEGEALWPEKFNLERLETIRQSLGNEEFLPQYQGRPGAEEGVLFKAEWLRRCYLPRPLEADQIEKMNKVIVVDPGGSKKKSDFTQMWCVGLTGGRDHFILDGVRDKLTLHQRGELLLDMALRWHPIDKILYEEYGMQADIEHIEYMMSRKNRYYWIQAVGGKIPKPERIRALEPLFRTGRIKLPKVLPYCPMADDLPREVDIIRQFIEEEYKAYPSALHDDGLDALARICDPRAELDYPEPEGKEKKEMEAERSWKERSQRRVRGDWMTI